MKVNAGRAESLLEAFQLLVDTQNRPIDSNSSIFFKTIDGTIQLMTKDF